MKVPYKKVRYSAGDPIYKTPGAAGADIPLCIEDT
jgi:hypothetical protein